MERVRRVRAVAVAVAPEKKLTTPPGEPTETEKMFLPQPNGGRVVELVVEIRCEVASGNVTEKMMADWVQRAITRHHWFGVGYVGRDMEGTVVRPVAVTHIKKGGTT
jgi:hypothetical protein